MSSSRDRMPYPPPADQDEHISETDTSEETSSSGDENHPGPTTTRNRLVDANADLFNDPAPITGETPGTTSTATATAEADPSANPVTPGVRRRGRGRPRNTDGPRPSAAQQKHARETVRNRIVYPITNAELERLLQANSWNVDRTEQAWRAQVEYTPGAGRPRCTILEERRHLLIELSGRINWDRTPGVNILSWMDLERLLSAASWDVDEAANMYEDPDNDPTWTRELFLHLRTPRPSQYRQDERVAYLMSFTLDEDIAHATAMLRRNGWDVAAAIAELVRDGPEAEADDWIDAEDEEKVDPEADMPGSGKQDQYGIIKSQDRTYWIIDEKRDKACSGFNDPTKLVIRRFKKGKLNNAKYKPMSDDDWQVKEKVSELNKWRAQQFRRINGTTVKGEGIPYHFEEDHWLWQYFCRWHEQWRVENPGQDEFSGRRMDWAQLTTDFNATFAHQTIGGDPRPRPLRAQGALYTQAHRIQTIIQDFHVPSMPAHPHLSNPTQGTGQEDEVSEGGEEESALRNAGETGKDEEEAVEDTDNGQGSAAQRARSESEGEARKPSKKKSKRSPRS